MDSITTRADADSAPRTSTDTPGPRLIALTHDGQVVATMSYEDLAAMLPAVVERAVAEVLATLTGGAAVAS